MTQSTKQDTQDETDRLPTNTFKNFVETQDLFFFS